MLAIFRKHRDGIETRTVMMELALKASVLGGKNKIPVAARASVVTPVRDGGVIPQNRIESHVRLVLITEILHPCIDFLLPCGVPGHFTAEGIRFGFPMIGARAYFLFYFLISRGRVCALDVRKYLDKDS